MLSEYLIDVKITRHVLLKILKRIELSIRSIGTNLQLLRNIIGFWAR